MDQKVIRLITSVNLCKNTRELNSIFRDLSNIKSHYTISFLNAHGLNLACENEKFSESLLSSNIILRDGIGMNLLYKSLGINGGLNMNGTDFIPILLNKLKGSTVALIGTQEPYLSNAVKVLKNQGHNVVLAVDGFKDRSTYLDLLKKHCPQIVILGMGMPKQEILAKFLRESLEEEAFIWVNGGAIIDFIGGKVDRAPNWVQNLGMEWAYRLAHEPKRLFKRYVIGNAVFMLRIPHIVRLAKSSYTVLESQTRYEIISNQ